MSKVYTFKAELWRWQTSKFTSKATGAWHFVTLPKKLFTEIRATHGKGMIKVQTTIGKTSWNNSLFPHTKEGTYLISVKKMVREKEGIFEGDMLKVRFKIV